MLSTEEKPATREELMNRYASAIPPRGSSTVRQIARHSKSRARQLRGQSVAAVRTSTERYVPNSASQEYENMLVETRRAKSVAHQSRADTLAHAEQALAQRRKDRQFRALSGKSFHSDNLIFLAMCLAFFDLFDPG